MDLRKIQERVAEPFSVVSLKTGLSETGFTVSLLFLLLD